MENTAYLIFLLWAGLCLASWILQHKLYKTIQKKFPEKYIELGQPRISSMWDGFVRPPYEHPQILGDMMASTIKVLKYLIKGDKQLDSDAEVVYLKRLNQVTFFTGIGVLISLPFLVLLMPLMAGA